MLDDDLDDWCRRWLGAQPGEVLFEVAHLSRLVALRLSDGREIVVKTRPPAPRLRACAAVHAHLWAAGFPCPQPLAGPAPLGALSATAESLMAGGELLVRTPEAPRLYAEAFNWLLRLAPPVAAVGTLAPPPAWVWWDNDQPGTWPEPDDIVADLNAQPGPAWLEEAGRRATDRLAQDDGLPVIGHCDWWSQNLRWQDGALYAVHDWDSIAVRTKASFAGAASAVFCATGAPGDAATIDESEAFLAAYERARGRAWTADERQVCWAAGLWGRAFNARKMAEAGGGPELDVLRGEAPERLRRAGA